MPLSKNKKEQIKETIANSLRRKFSTYTPDGKTVMPFHTRLLGKDRMALFSFIQSLNTTFGTVIYEPVAATVAEGNFDTVEMGKKSQGMISEVAKEKITDIVNSIAIGKNSSPNQKKEVEQLRKVCRTGSAVKIPMRKADLYVVKGNWHYPIELKTAKPNIDGFEKYKENLLKWTAAILYENPQALVGAILAIPYNPFHPEPYRHWTMRSMVEVDTQLKVAENFWSFLAGGDNIFDDLLNCFGDVGMEMRQEIDDYFSAFRKMSKNKK